MNIRIDLKISPSQQNTLATRAQALGMSRNAYVQHLLFDRDLSGEGLTLTPAFFHDAVEACARTVSLPRTQVEALVGVVIKQLHQARQGKA